MNHYPAFKEALWCWFRVAIYSFGGPASQIALMHKIFVQEKQWIGEKRFLHALNYCMLLPGPEAQQLAIYLGWLLHRYRGGLTAGLLFVLPGVISILIVSILYARYQNIDFVQLLFYGIKAAVIAIVFEALFNMSKKVLKTTLHYLIALGAFISIFFFSVPFPLIILSAAILGLLLGSYLKIETVEDEVKEEDIVANNPHLTRTNLKHTLLTALLWSVIWLFPVVLCLFALGLHHVFTQEALFFTKTAVISFGGAYAVLAYITQESVLYYKWLKPGEMLDGLGMAETLPGPLIKVVQFVGFLAAFRFAGVMDPLWAGVIGSLITAWVTFIPAFLFIFTGAPYIESLRKIKWLQSALTAVTAAVVGVILNLSIWFMLHALFRQVHVQKYNFFTLYQPEWATFDWGTLFIALVAAYLIFRWKANILVVLLSSIALGFAIKLIV